MKYMIAYKKIYFVLFVFSFLFFSCEKDNGSLINVRIKNNTGVDIKNFHIGDIKIGTIKKDEIYIGKLNQITFDGRQMVNSCCAKLNGEKYTNIGVWCGTGVVLNTFYDGYFELEVFILEKSKHLVLTKTN